MDSLTSALSGLRAAEQRLAASAQDVANLETPDRRPLRVVQTEAEPAGSGTVAHVQRAPEPARVDFAEEAVEQIRAVADFRAALRIVGAERERLGALLDVRA